MKEKLHFFTHPGWALRNDWDILESLRDLKRKKDHPRYCEDLFTALEEANDNGDRTVILYDNLEQTNRFLEDNGYSLKYFDLAIHTTENSGEPTGKGMEYFARELDKLDSDSEAIIHGEVFPGCAATPGWYLENYTEADFQEGVLFPRKARYSWIR